MQEGEMLGLEGMAFLHYLQEQKLGMGNWYQKMEEQRHL